MTIRDWLSIASILAILLVPLITALIKHIKHDERREVRLENVEKEIGSHHTGLRGNVHEQRNMLTWLSGCVWFIANKVGLELPKREK